MASNGNEMSVSQPSLPIFNGERYEQWNIKMETLFRSQDLWGLVEKGFSNIEDVARLRGNEMKDAKTLFFIQQALH